MQEGRRAYKIVFPKSDAHEARIQNEIVMNARIAALDPNMERFVVPSNVYRTNLQTLRDTNRPLYESFVYNCLEDRTKLPENVYIGSMPILRQIEERLNPYYKIIQKMSVFA